MASLSVSCSISSNKNLIVFSIALINLMMCHCLPPSSSSTKGPAKNATATATPNCESVENVFQNRGIMSNEIPRRPLQAITLRVCDVPSAGTCCTDDMESKLTNYAKQQIEKNTKDSIQKLSAVLKTRAQKFTEHFKELLAQSKREFHEMFKRTYGAIYEQNAQVFSDLFNELEGYYVRGKVDLVEAMDSFFNTLYQKMFTVINMQYNFDDKYLGCVSENMKDLKPFGDVPDKLSVQIKRSFVATRTFSQALNTAAEVTKNVQNIRLSPECTNALTKMQVCGACSGHSEKPCYSYCINLMKGCLYFFSDISSEWDNFVLSMEKISERLLGPFNIVNVVEPINIKISEAIMNFQDSGSDITHQIFQGCGRPQLGQMGRRKRDLGLLLDTNEDFSLELDAGAEEMRVKREAKPGKKTDLQYETLNFSDMENNGGKNRRKNKNKKPNKNNFEEETRDTYMDKLIKDIRQKVKDSKKFWANLPYQTCNNEDIAAHSSVDSQCWNGQNVDSYPHFVGADHKKVVDLSASSSARYSSLINQQLYKLRKANSQLRNAYNGMDVEWGDQEEPYYGSGSGSGLGSDEDIESGSGMGHFDLVPRIPELPPPTMTTEEATRGVSHSDPPRIETTPSSTVGTSTVSSTETSAGGGASSTRMPQMTRLKALSVFLVPIFVTWFGGMFTELL